MAVFCYDTHLVDRNRPVVNSRAFPCALPSQDQGHLARVQDLAMVHHGDLYLEVLALVHPIYPHLSLVQAHPALVQAHPSLVQVHL